MKLNKEQYIAAHHTVGPMLVLAGPGSGKTHLLVERIKLMIEEHHIAPEHILVITFSKKAAEEMQDRFNRNTDPDHYPVTFGTFHAVFYHILLEDDPSVGRLITEEEQKRILESFKHEDTELLAGMISAYKNFGSEFYSRCESGRGMTEQERDEFELLIKRYEDICRKEGLIDFDDMILMCGRLLYKHEKILRKWQDRFRYILVDEFQDINDGQYGVLRLLAGDAMNVFAVGDDDQSIYAFRGSRPQLMKKFIHQFRGCRQVTLTMNYRCCENVIGASDTVIRHNTDRFDRPMQRHLPSKSGGDVELIYAENSDIQAEYVCDMTEELINEYGYRASDIAVLYRSEHCVKMFVNTAEKRGIKINDQSGSYIPKEIKIHRSYMRAHEHTADRADYFLIMNNPDRGLSRESLAITTGNYIDDMKRYYADDHEKLEAVRDLERTIKTYGAVQEPSKKTDVKDMIHVMTAHASKGLEFRCVFIIGLQEGLFPHYKNLTGTGAQEERRLMYVAMTRAKERLYMCAIGAQHGKRPSRFIREASEKKAYIKDILRLRTD